jgi:hypothetical protein
MNFREGSVVRIGDTRRHPDPSTEEHQMTSTATRAVSQTARAAAAQPAPPPARSTVAASGGSPTTSREPPGQSAAATNAEHPATNDKPAVSRKLAAAKAAKPKAQFAAVSKATRIPELAKWIAARPSFTFADAAAASAPSPCSLTVMAYTLPDARLTSALAELGYVVTAGGKNGYTVTAIRAPRPGSRLGSTTSPRSS